MIWNDYQFITLVVTNSGAIKKFKLTLYLLVIVNFFYY